MRLVADIGGTNSRLALAPIGTGSFFRQQNYINADFTCFNDIITDYLSHCNDSVQQLVIAMAGHVTNNVGRLTNLGWVIDGNEIASSFGEIPVLVMNDLTALGHSALQLAPNQIYPLLDLPVSQQAQRQALVVGIGTGFNLSPIVECNGTTVCTAVEAGHTSLFASIYLELERLKCGIADCFPTVESLFSGRGRRKFMAQLTGKHIQNASTYIAKQGNPENQIYDYALDKYAELIGMLLAEYKVSYLPFAGIFIAGGVARSSLVGNRAILCAKTAMSDNEFIKVNTPIWVVNDDAAALVGCATIEL